MDYNKLQEYIQLSPFEIQFELSRLAGNFKDRQLLNAGRGNPNWIATTPRDAFFTLGHFAIEESKRTFIYPHGGLHPEIKGIYGRFQQYLKNNQDAPGIKFLDDSIKYGIEKLNFNPDEWLYELVTGAIGDFYPEPDRMRPYAEKVIHSFLLKFLCNNQEKLGRYDLFATEGGTGAIKYIFDSLFENNLLHKGDKIAIGSPIFTPYLEIPRLSNYDLIEVEIKAFEEDDWQYSDSELEKLKDPSIKAFFVVNPGNPQSKAIKQETLEKIADIVTKHNPNLIIISDDVYATFVDNFRSLMAEIPKNTICVYSFSKHLGCTGWRLGVIALHEDNMIDQMIAKQNLVEKNTSNERYGCVCLEPEKMKFIDRMVADSRSVALKHTAGLSLPQQTQMTLFALFFLLEDNTLYLKGTEKTLNNRIHQLYKSLGIPCDIDTTGTNYYAIIDILDIASERYSASFARWMEETYNPLSFVFALADLESIVLLPGAGFDMPPWSIRISIANLRAKEYKIIGMKMSKLLETIHQHYLEIVGNELKNKA
ncbi:MAG: bifunctional aspartate transaminase/aspartate 4-decarboxylase [Methanobacteriaceae archaeon]|nr:bifunctional aspartate transaminase/aspartate 4-decarboxylase [Methanobacteriaceae archaeon]